MKVCSFVALEVVRLVFDNVLFTSFRSQSWWDESPSSRHSSLPPYTVPSPPSQISDQRKFLKGKLVTVTVHCTGIITATPLRGREYSREVLLQFKKEKVAREAAERQAAAGMGDGFGGFGGFGGGEGDSGPDVQKQEEEGERDNTGEEVGKSGLFSL